MDEPIDIINEQGNYTGEVCLKSDAHQLGLWHASVDIWLYTKDGKVLIQKRAATKDTFPNKWDVSVAGHIGTGEKPLVAAQRELLEEIGLKIQKEQFKHVGIFKIEHLHRNDLIDREFHYVYIAELKKTLTELILQEEEVADLKLISISKLVLELKNSVTKLKYVPYDSSYFKTVFKVIDNSL